MKTITLEVDDDTFTRMKEAGRFISGQGAEILAMDILEAFNNAEKKRLGEPEVISIRMAQVEAGEAAVIESLRSRGIIQ